MKLAMRAGSSNRFAVIFLVFMILVGASGCTVKLIADYDEFTEQMITNLHRKMEGFFINAKANGSDPAWTHENKKGFYADVRVDLEVIKLRNSIRDKNDITMEQLNLLSKSIDDLEELHKTAGFGVVGVVESAHSAFQSSFKAILKLELAKSRSD